MARVGPTVPKYRVQFTVTFWSMVNRVNRDRAHYMHMTTVANDGLLMLADRRYQHFDASNTPLSRCHFQLGSGGWAPNGQLSQIRL